MSGVEVEDFSTVSTGLSKLRIPEQRYVMFTHNGQVAAIRQIWSAIFESSLPATSFPLADDPQLERYGDSFDPASGLGDIEIWIPVESPKPG